VYTTLRGTSENHFKMLLTVTSKNWKYVADDNKEEKQG